MNSHLPTCGSFPIDALTTNDFQNLVVADGLATALYTNHENVHIAHGFVPKLVAKSDTGDRRSPRTKERERKFGGTVEVVYYAAVVSGAREAGDTVGEMKVLGEVYRAGTRAGAISVLFANLEAAVGDQLRRHMEKGCGDEDDEDDEDYCEEDEEDNEEGKCKGDEQVGEKGEEEPPLKKIKI